MRPSSPSWAQDARVAARPSPLCVCCAAQFCPSRLTASQLWLGSECSARCDKYSICWEAVSLPDPLQNEPWKDQLICCLSVCVCVCVCVCVFSPQSLVTLSVFKFVNLLRLSALLATVCPSVCLCVYLLDCLIVNKAANLFVYIFSPEAYQPVCMSVWRHCEHVSHIFVLPHWYGNLTHTYVIWVSALLWVVKISPTVS